MRTGLVPGEMCPVVLAAEWRELDERRGGKTPRHQLTRVLPLRLRPRNPIMSIPQMHPSPLAFLLDYSWSRENHSLAQPGEPVDHCDRSALQNYFQVVRDPSQCH